MVAERMLIGEDDEEIAAVTVDAVTEALLNTSASMNRGVIRASKLTGQRSVEIASIRRPQIQTSATTVMFEYAERHLVEEGGSSVITDASHEVDHMIETIRAITDAPKSSYPTQHERSDASSFLD